MYKVWCLRPGKNHRIKRYYKRVNTLSEVARIMTDSNHIVDCCSKDGEPLSISNREYKILLSKCFAISTKQIKGKAMDKRFKVGMYGGKFLPFHKGHLMCMERAAEMCETLYLLMFIGGSDERRAIAVFGDSGDSEYLSVESRISHIKSVVKSYPNVIFKVIDVSGLLYPDGTENWDAETPLVLDACGQLDAVFGSEPSYAEYFSRAYPTAEYVMIDPKRNICPISGTMVRNMDKRHRDKWIVGE